MLLSLQLEAAKFAAFELTYSSFGATFAFYG